VWTGTLQNSIACLPFYHCNHGSFDSPIPKLSHANFLTGKVVPFTSLLRLTYAFLKNVFHVYDLIMLKVTSWMTRFCTLVSFTFAIQSKGDSSVSKFFHAFSILPKRLSEIEYVCPSNRNFKSTGTDRCVWTRLSQKKRISFSLKCAGQLSAHKTRWPNFVAWVLFKCKKKSKREITSSGPSPPIWLGYVKACNCFDPASKIPKSLVF